MSKDIHKKKHLSSFQLIILGFASVILLGAIILMLPVSSAEGVITPFNQTLFTSTSAVCVTGLAVLDTGSYWSVFGQVVILLLIQIGGLGVVTVAVSVFMLSGRKISLMQRSTMQNAISAHKVGGIVRLTKFILKGTLFIEMAGALALLPVFYHDFGRKGIWMAVFHSISAFCNAGFDILGTPANPFPSITAYAENPIVNVVIMFLIIAGGIGFLTWEDICINKTHFRKYHMQSKIILVTTALLIVLPAVFFFFSDFTHLSVGKRLLACRRFAKFYGRRYEDDNFCSTYIECICHIPESGKCRNIWKKNRVECDKECINDCNDVLYVIFMWRNYDQCI